MMPRYDHELEMKRQEMGQWAERQRLVNAAGPEQPRWSFREALSRAVSLLAGQFAAPQPQPKWPVSKPESARTKLATDSGTFRIR